MSKFAKIKKTLAVSLCSSMLFSGTPKTSGMDDELIKNLTQQVSSLTQQVADLSKENIGKAFGISVGQALTYAPIAYVLEELVRHSIIMHIDYSRARTIYKKSCYFLRLMNNHGMLDDMQKNNAREKLKLARNLVVFIKNNNSSWLNYFLNISQSSSDVRSDKNKAIKILAEAFPNNENECLTSACITSNPEKVVENVFNEMKSLVGFNEVEFNQYVNSDNLPTVQSVLP